MGGFSKRGEGNDTTSIIHHGDESVQPRPKCVEGLHNVCVVAAGSCHSLALLTEGRVFGWGDGTDACLGLELSEGQLVPLEYPGLRVSVESGHGW